MAKRKSGRLTKAEIRKAGGLKQAWAARKAHTKTTRKAGKTARKAKKHTRKARKTRKAAKRHTKTTRKSAKRVAAGKKAARTRARKKAIRRAAAKKSHRKTKRTRKAARRSAPRKARKSGKRRAKRSRKSRALATVKLPRRRRGAKRSVSVTVKSGKRRRTRRLSVPRKAKRLYMVASERKRHHRRRHTSRRRRGAMENPMNGTELFIGALTGLTGFLAADFVDRLLATHALTDTGKKNAAGMEIYGDPQGAAGTSYAGLYNATAICAPMDAARWAVGGLMAAVPLTIAHFVTAPLVRSSMQFFGFAAGVRILGKGLIDLMAVATRSTELGQQLYDGEMRAQVLAANQGSLNAPGLSDLPQSGLGRAALGAGKAAAADCAPCAEKAANGVGYPSMPRTPVVSTVTPTETPTQATPVTQNLPPAPQPPPPPPQAPPAFRSNALTGAPKANRNRFNWGDADSQN